MTANYHKPIVAGESNAPATVNTRLSSLDGAISTHETELDNAAGNYADINTRFNSLVLAGGNVTTQTSAIIPGAQKVVYVDSTTGFVNNARVVYANSLGVLEYNTIATVNSPTQLTLANNISIGIQDNTLFTMVSESEYQASLTQVSGGTATATLPAVVEWLEREINVKAFGAYGDTFSHQVGAEPHLGSMRALYPLTHAAFGISTGDELDWCAIQEAVLTGGTVTGIDAEDVFIPAGTYKVNRTITVPLAGGNGRSMTITGGGRRGVPTSGTLIISTTAISIFHIPGLTSIRNLALQGFDKLAQTSIGVRIGGKTDAGDYFEHTNCVHVTLDNLRFGSGFYNCIHSLYECDQLEITHCTSSGNLGNAAVYLSNDYAANNISPSANVVISQCHFANSDENASGSAKYGLYIMGTEDSAVRNTVLRGHDNLIFLTGKAGGTRNECFTIDGVHAEILQDLKAFATKRWTPNTTYTTAQVNAGIYIRPGQAGANGWWYKCTQAGTTGNNPTLNSIRTSSYAWTLSGRGTNEYYCTLAGGGDPGLAQPFGVMVYGIPYTFNNIGALTALVGGQWGYGTNDALGFSTIYVRLSDDHDGAGPNPQDLANFSIWMTSQEPAWPTAYGDTVPDGGVVWQAYKQSNVINIDGGAGNSISGGLRVNGIWCDGFVSFIQNNLTTVGDSARTSVTNCNVRATDMVYNHRVNLRSAISFDTCQLIGCIKPFNLLSSSNTQAQVYMRFCSKTEDHINGIGGTTRGVGSWMTNEPNYSYDSDDQVTDTFQLDLRLHSQLTVGTGTSTPATPVTIYVPIILSVAYQVGFRGKTITITHATGTDGLTLSFHPQQPLLYNGATTATLQLPDIGDSVTIRFTIVPGGNIRWVIVGSYGI
jgi:hypothetical protein